MPSFLSTFALASESARVAVLESESAGVAIFESWCTGVAVLESESAGAAPLESDTAGAAAATAAIEDSDVNAAMQANAIAERAADAMLRTGPANEVATGRR